MDLDVRKDKISKLKEYKDEWQYWVAFIFGFVFAVFFYPLLVDSPEEGREYLLVVMFRTLFVFVIIKMILNKFANTENKLKTLSDEMLDFQYNEMVKKEHFKKLTSRIVKVIVIIGAIAIFFDKKEFFIDELAKYTSLAECAVVSTDLKKEMFMVSEKPDYGISLLADVKNSGEAGNIFIEVKLTSSEGEYSREQKVYLESGAEETLKYQFPEPTINATNIRSSFSCSPKEKK